MGIRDFGLAAARLARMQGDEAVKHSDLDLLVIQPSVEDVVEETYRLRRTLDGLDVFATCPGTLRTV